MNKTAHKYILTFSMLFVSISPCLAIDISNIYFGANTGYTKSDVYESEIANNTQSLLITDDISSDNNTFAFKLTVGYVVSQYVTIDSSFINSGKYSLKYVSQLQDSFSDAVFSDNIRENTAVTGLNISALGNLPFSSKLFAFARIGITRWQIEESGTWESGVNDATTSSTYNKSHSELGLTAGLGLRYLFGSKNNFEFRTELERYQVGSEINDENNSINVITAGLMYYFNRKSENKIKPVIPLLDAQLSDVSVDEGGVLQFSLNLSEPANSDIQFELFWNNIVADNSNALLADVAELSVDNGESWQKIPVNNATRFVIPTGKSTASIRIYTVDDDVASIPGIVSVQLKTNSHFIKKSTLTAYGTILENDAEKPVIAAIEPENITPIATPDVSEQGEALLEVTTMAALEVAVPEVIDIPVAVAFPKLEEEKQQITVLTLTPAVPEQQPKKRVLPIVKPFEESKATANERAVSNLMWNDVKAYNRFDGESPLLLPAIDLVDMLMEKNASASGSVVMYEEAEISAKNSDSGIAIWGNALEFNNKIYIESHLSLIDEPVVFFVELGLEDKKSLLLSISRTRFAFGLKELSSSEVKKHKLITLGNVSVHQDINVKSNVLTKLKPDELIESSDTQKDWFKVTAAGVAGWINARQLAVVPDYVYVQADELQVYSEAGSGDMNVMNKPQSSLKVLNVKIENEITWMQLQWPTQHGWVDSRSLKPKPILPMTEFLVGIQYYQKQEFVKAIQSLERYIKAVEWDEENNVTLSTAYQMLALSYMQQGNWESARETLDKAIALTKFDPAVYGFKALALLGDSLTPEQPVKIGDVLKNLEYALYLEPENELAKNLIATLDKTLKTQVEGHAQYELSSSDQTNLNKLAKHYRFAGLD